MTDTTRTGIEDLGRVHIVGIGGAGMSAIARVLLGRGVPVSGSDARDSRRVTALRALGARVNVGHDAAHVNDVDTVISSTAVKADNVEIASAISRQIRVMSRAEGLACVLADARVVAIAGTHGKTTTTSMLAVALQRCGADPSFIIGSELNESGSNAHVGTGDSFIVEADESDGTFLMMTPVASVVTNVEPDHLDHWGSLEALEDAFLEFARRLAARQGFLAICVDDPGARRLAEKAKSHGIDVRTYGMSVDADYRIDLMELGLHGWKFDVIARGVRLGVTELAVPGQHNVLNATAALATGIGLGLPATDLRAGIAGFTGTRRRFDHRGTAGGVRVFDDYAHHPTEIAATLRAAREMVGEGRLIVACQPYRWYRTAMFIPEYAQALSLADEVVVLEVYGPGETPIPGASGQTIAAAISLPEGAVMFEPSLSAVATQLAQRVRAGDLVLTLGAEEVSVVGPELVDILRAGENGS
jgi:UDP-N-acetylmuramate--alanine ligase